MVGVDEDADSAKAYFVDRGFDVRIEEADLHAEHMAKGEPGRASLFVENRRYFCVDLLRDGGVVAARYAQAETPEDALARARERYASEQG